MHPKRRRTLTMLVIGISGIALAVGLVLYALRKNIDLYYTPHQALEAHLSDATTFRLGGMVEKGSVRHAAKSLAVSFRLTDYTAQMTVIYRGVLPTLFREGQGVIAQGHLNKHGIFVAREVLAKHDENYHPPNM